MKSKGEIKGHGNGLSHASKAASMQKKNHAGHGTQGEGCAPMTKTNAGTPQGKNKY